ncbi:hypothetical protein B0J13DRAFT_590416 [Dactylonectria estremocensis]|uniref:Uncharacterized protein n=1 Tax=Dactylonectria estremocensis TaxID=1079267 RepID=A0A9P9DAN6_9HYPO|nr:hypothetical protein B0J13DRAFT_590416 [Dactylonectria estremocensis]
MREGQCPPSYKSHLSHNSTRSQSPNPPSEEQKRRGERKRQLIREHRASFPSNQFDAEKSEEIDRLYEANRNLSRRRPAEPLEPESESETDSAAEGEAPLFCLPSKRVDAKPRRPKSAEELRWIAERRPIREREREASRPFHRFVYQVSKERERIQGEMNPPPPLLQTSLISTWRATAQSIIRLPFMPGQEVPRRSIFGALLPAESNGQASGIRNASQQEPPADTLSGALESDGYGTGGTRPRRNLFRSPSPAESSHGPVSGSLNASPQEPSLATDPAELLHGDVSHSSTASNPRRRHAASREAPQSGPQQRRRFEGGQALLGLVHSTKVSKARGKNRPGPRRRLNASELPSEAQQSLPEPDVPAPLPKAAPVPPRRSKRLQVAEPKTAADPSGIAATDPHVVR